jgi:central glycolytic genes regulator
MQEMTWFTLKRIAEDQVDEIYRRAMLLERIHAIGPVGRRTLAVSMQLTEREVRAAAEALKDKGLVSLNTSGMQFTVPLHQRYP